VRWCGMGDWDKRVRGWFSDSEGKVWRIGRGGHDVICADVVIYEDVTKCVHVTGFRGGGGRWLWDSKPKQLLRGLEQ
jgi:hypothetical protein